MIKKSLFLIVPSAFFMFLLFQKNNNTSFESLFMKGFTNCYFFEKTKSEVIYAFGYCSCNNSIDFQFDINEKKIYDYKNFLIEKEYIELLLSIETIEKSLNKKDFDSYKKELHIYENILSSLNDKDRMIIEDWIVNYV